MSITTVLLVTSLVACALSSPCRPESNDLRIVTREEWNARPPTGIVKLEKPPSLVIIHHSYIPGACHSFTECSATMRDMQDMHQIHNEWADIGYNFAVGSDGLVYEGRGWEAVGAHAAGYNINSIGIVLIGDWVSNVPPTNQMDAVKKLVKIGTDLGHINPEYSLIGHRQVGATECPGQALFDEIQTWDKFQGNIEL